MTKTIFALTATALLSLSSDAFAGGRTLNNCDVVSLSAGNANANQDAYELTVNCPVRNQTVTRTFNILNDVIGGVGPRGSVQELAQKALVYGLKVDVTVNREATPDVERIVLKAK